MLRQELHDRRVPLRGLDGVQERCLPLYVARRDVRALLEQLLHNLCFPAVGGAVQRRLLGARLAVVWVCAVVEEKHGYGVAAGDFEDAEEVGRGDAGWGAVVVWVCAVGEEEAGGEEVAPHAALGERGPAVDVDAVDLGAVLEEELDVPHFAAGGEVEGCAAVFVDGVDGHAVVDEELHQLERAHAGGLVQCCCTALVDAGHGDVVGEKHLDRVEAALEDGEMQRVPSALFEIDLGAVFDEDLCHLGQALVAGVMQRSERAREEPVFGPIALAAVRVSERGDLLGEIGICAHFKELADEGKV